MQSLGFEVPEEDVPPGFLLDVVVPAAGVLEGQDQVDLPLPIPEVQGVHLSLHLK